MKPLRALLLLLVASCTTMVPTSPVMTCAAFQATPFLVTTAMSPVSFPAGSCANRQPDAESFVVPFSGVWSVTARLTFAAHTGFGGRFALLSAGARPPLAVAEQFVADTFAGVVLNLSAFDTLHAGDTLRVLAQRWNVLGDTTSTVATVPAWTTFQLVAQ